ncbi:MAG: hypothetical protein WBD47_13350 [Phormidesmis sp.]
MKAAAILLSLMLIGCAVSPTSSETSSVTESQPTEDAAENMAGNSRVMAVEATPSDAGYRFAVTVESDETGCDRYANWWEIITPDGELLYRRILAHSHVDEQPFTRSGGPVEVAGDQDVIVRSHMNTTGYSTQAMQGTANAGLAATTLPADFAPELAAAGPQPSGCAF